MMITKKEKARDKHLQKTYGISLVQYTEILARQNGCCAICLRPASSFKRSLAVDHSHSTLELRGILCPFCNRGLRYYRDDPENMERAGAYLRNRTGLFAPAKKRKRKAPRKTNPRRKTKARTSQRKKH